ncbi:DUF6286 domain-containing Asp23/Gls24 family envelope stress response protein [Streptomyces niveus]|uniref:DUF6286 domain-containing protein n=1 Tax=Streptomyces niveus TaxID=193462 RepID=A0A1U9QUT3_STRNV|nr:DUF6286 domain-containing Asp23/Gls24 family envelope stress response protein [Streptomyces niveus]AQU68014.1 hypothetical protein BBN63_19080 [Streptomyces niveus]
MSADAARPVPPPVPPPPLPLPPADRGATRIADRVVRRVAGRAAAEVLGAGPGGGEVVRTSVDVRGSRVDGVHLDVGLAYPAHLETSGAELQRRVTERTAYLTGLTVGRTTVRITRLAQSTATEPTEWAESARSRRRAARRPWSERRAPAAVFALLGAAVSGALLAVVVAVVVGRGPSGVRLRTLDWLTSHGPADTVVAVGAAVAVVAGLWTLFAALTPGLRGRLPMATPDATDATTNATATAVDRPAVAALVRHRAADVPGVSRVRVTARRRRIAVRARIGFGDPAGTRDALTRTTEGVVAGLGLAKPPRVRVRVSRDAYWQPPGTHDGEQRHEQNHEQDREQDREQKEATPHAPPPAPASAP